MNQNLKHKPPTRYLRPAGSPLEAPIPARFGSVSIALFFGKTNVVGRRAQKALGCLRALNLSAGEAAALRQ